MQWGLTQKIAALAGFLAAVAALADIVTSIVNKTKPLACSIGISGSWCALPTVADTWSLEIGGPGGDPFMPLTCRQGEALVGLHGRALAKDIGPFVFSLGPLCAAARFKAGRVTLVSETPSKGDEVGSAQGDPFELKCPASTVVVGSGFSSAIIKTNWGMGNYVVAPLVLRCASALGIDDAPTKTVTGAGDVLAFASRKPFACPEGSAAYGIKGRSGQFLDAISMGCRAPK